MRAFKLPAQQERELERAVLEAGFSTEEIRFHARVLLRLVGKYMVGGGKFTNGEYEAYKAAESYLSDPDV